MKKINIIALSIITSMSLQAANVPNIGDALKQVKPPKLKKEKKDIPQIKIEENVPKELKDGKKIAVKKFLISGATHLSNDELKDIVTSYENQKLSFKDMQKVATLITKAYRQKGYFVARAYIPMQNILTQNGSLKINVIEGNYGEFVLENKSLVKDEVVQSNLDAIKDENIVSTNTLERAMLIINDTPGVVVNKAEVRPGKKVGTSDFIIGTSATNKYSGYILGDNYGSQYTGKHRIMAGVDVNSPFDIGDKLTFSGLTSDEIGLINGRIAYDFPMNAKGLRGEVAISKTTYELGSSYKNLDALGSSDSISFKTVYPYVKSRLKNINVYAEISLNKMKDEIQASNIYTKKSSKVLTVGIDYSEDKIMFNKNSQSRANFYLTVGNLKFNDKEDRQADENGANTNGTFTKLNLELGQDFELTPKIRWENSFQAQYALGDKNLDGSQDLSLGGIYGVKYYPDGEESAENGFIFNTELFYTLPNYKELNSSISLFYDVGRAFMSQNITNEEPRTLQSFGLGYYGSYKDMFINAHLAQNIKHDVTSQKDYSSRFMIQAGWVF
ncbi:hemolysin activation/secretion protein [Malaciobacter marinus]|jgi:hemolysin activation/secretion protein|uniref:Hemolysin activation/secretion protein n=1 Tax=Malaciobacter marinus TaxID=505249 RepID=A0AB36ZTY7_9BACT|nr:ShlB/FhaC/HecB family hemolysin secretion/activation protein [Malaciobacter marinus]PPK57795.1 hemolysin activation/secretion protein [Malaciobacter marinus]